MNIDIGKFTGQIHTLSTLKRYNNFPHIKDESVAEHLAFTTLIVLKLYEKYRFNLHYAMMMAITHDIPEIYTSDVPHPVKRMYPQIAEGLRKAEDDSWHAFEGTFGTLGCMNAEMEKCKTIEAVIVNYADVLSVIQYCTQEMNLGNKYIQSIYTGAKERAKVLEEKLEELECLL